MKWSVEHTVSRRAEMDAISTGFLLPFSENAVIFERRILAEGIEAWLLQNEYFHYQKFNVILTFGD